MAYVTSLVMPLSSVVSSYNTHRYMGFLGGSDGKEPTCNAGEPSSILGLGRPLGEGNGNPLQCSCLENLHGQRNLAGYGPWGHKESDTTEQYFHFLHFYTHTHTHNILKQ